MLDTETTETSDGTPRRCLSVAAVTCRYGTVRSRWQQLTDPGIPIDPVSHSIHHIGNDHLAGEATFADVADELLAVLEPRDGETVILAAHNVGFDVSVLRYELQQTNQDLPDVPVLDTMGPLVALAGVELHRPSLNDLLAELGLANRCAHGALADAEACAAALLMLLERAAERGYSDRDELLAELGTTTTHRIKAGSRAKLPRPAAAHEDLPPGHLEGHREVLGVRAGTRTLAAWQASVTECAELRCGHLTGRVGRAEPNPVRLIGPVTAVLDGRVGDGDTAGAATVLAALMPLLEHLPPRKGRHGIREAPLRWPDTVAQLALGDPDRCARATGVCDEALTVANGSTHPGWGRLRSRRNQLAGRRQRLVVRPSGKFDEDGNPIPARRHHPAKPRRTRPMRFVDAGPVADPNAENAAS